MNMNAVQRAAKRIVSKIEASQAGEAPRRIPDSFIMKSGQFFVPERISMMMRPNPGEGAQAGKGVSPIAVRKEFRPIVDDKEWVPRYMLQGLSFGELEVGSDLGARFREIKNRIDAHRRRIEVYLMAGNNREKAARSIATFTARTVAKKIKSKTVGKQPEGMSGWFDWIAPPGRIPIIYLATDFIFDTAQDSADLVQDTIIGIPGATDADRVNLQNLQDIAATQRADRIAAGQSTDVQDTLLTNIQQSQDDLYAPTSVMVTETVNQVYDRTRSLIGALPGVGKYVLMGIAGLVVLKFLG